MISNGKSESFFVVVLVAAVVVVVIIVCCCYGLVVEVKRYDHHIMDIIITF